MSPETKKLLDDHVNCSIYANISAAGQGMTIKGKLVAAHDDQLSLLDEEGRIAHIAWRCVDAWGKITAEGL